MSVEELTRLLPQKNARFGAYTPKGDQVIARIMAGLVKKLIKLESEAKNWRDLSIAERLLAAEKAIKKCSLADDKHPGEGLSDSDVKDHIVGFVERALKASGLSDSLVREFLYEAA